MPPDGSVPHSPAGSMPGSPAKSGKFSWGFGRKSRTPSPSGSMFAGAGTGNDEDGEGFRGRKSNPSPSSFVVKSVVKQPGGVSLDVQDEHGIYSQSPTSPSGPWGSDSQFGPSDAQSNIHNDSYKRQKSRPIMSLGVPAGGPGGGVGYGGVNSSNDGRPEAEMRLAAATNAGALPFGASPSSPARPSSPGAGISAEQFQRKVRDRQNSIQNPKEPRQMSPVTGPRRAADIAAEARASSRDRDGGWTVEPDLSRQEPGRQSGPPPPHGKTLPPATWGDAPAPHHALPHPFTPPLHPHASGNASPISIPQPNGFQGAGTGIGADSPFGTPSPGAHSQFGPPEDRFGAADDRDARGRSASPGFAGFFKGIFGRSPKVDSGSSPNPAGMYSDEHAWMNGETSAPAPYDATQNGSSPSFFGFGSVGTGGGSGSHGPPITPLIKSPGVRNSLPSPLRFGASGPPQTQDPDEAEARLQKRESILQAQRIVDQERQRAIDAAVQRRPSNGPDTPWSPRQVIGDVPLMAPPIRAGIDTNARGASPIGRKPVPKLGPDEGAWNGTAGGGDALSRLESMLTPAQRIIQETRSKQLAEEKAHADQVARDTIARAAALSSTPTTQQNAAPTPIDKGKARQIDPSDDGSRNAAGETPVRRLSKKNPTKQVQLMAPNAPASGPGVTIKPVTPQSSGPAASSSASGLQGSRTAAGLMPGNGPLPKDMTMTDALQEMMVRFYRFERYSVPLLRSLEARLIDIERDAQIALQSSDTVSANSARDREMDRWVSEMTGMMKHEIGQLRAACREIKEGREIIAHVAQSFNGSSQPSKVAAAPTPAPATTPAVTASATPSEPSTAASAATISSAAPASSVRAAPTASTLSDASTTQKVPGSKVTSSAAAMAPVSSPTKVPLTPATLKAVPRPDPGRTSPSSVTADPGLGVSATVEPKPIMIPVNKDGAVAPVANVVTSHQARQTNISSASFQSAFPVAQTPQRDASASTVRARFEEPSSPSADLASGRPAPAAAAPIVIPAADRRSPSPNSKGRPRYTTALGGSVLDSSTRTRSPERIRSATPSKPFASAMALEERVDSPGPPASEADSSRSTQSVEDRLKALLRGPESAAAVLDKSPTMTEAELEKEVMSHTTSPPVTEHLRWRSKDSSRSDSPNPTVRSGTPSTPNGASLHKESYFSGLAYGRATPPLLSSSPERGTGVFGLMPNRHLKASSSSSLANNTATAVGGTTAPTTGTSRSSTLPASAHAVDPSSVSGTTIAKTILRANNHTTFLTSPAPTGRLNVASTQPIMASPAKRTMSTAEYTGVPSEKANDITTATHASETLRARAASYLKASSATADEGLSPKPGSWASARFGGSGGESGYAGAGGLSGSATTSTLDSSASAGESKSKFDGLPGGSAIRSSTWLASDSTNTSLNSAANKYGQVGNARMATIGAGGLDAWTKDQSTQRRPSNTGAVGANATLKEKLAFFDSAR
ncbi:hypothetical protein OC835_003512 [Tilletia horrida]|nr:hypothetical protein OC835_003512 [Tilletia horrida]